jgi:hypothetical protein
MLFSFPFDGDKKKKMGLGIWNSVERYTPTRLCVKHRLKATNSKYGDGVQKYDCITDKNSENRVITILFTKVFDSS